MSAAICAVAALSPSPAQCLFPMLFHDTLLHICKLGSSVLLIFTSVFIRDSYIVLIPSSKCRGSQMSPFYTKWGKLRPTEVTGVVFLRLKSLVGA